MGRAPCHGVESPRTHHCVEGTTVRQRTPATAEWEFVVVRNVQSLRNIFNGERSIALLLEGRESRRAVNILRSIGASDQFRIGVRQQRPQTFGETVLCFDLESVIDRAALI